MRKLTLDPENLRVESFIAAERPAGRGTVHGARAELVPALPADGSGCTDPCMSNQSECPIESCGSDCGPAGPGTGY
ncbi:MAG TPA: hypothetical protein VFJ16_25490 [Longimicrobium sp.]|nr:hypothetical protein [Longimicrobium sp.]